MGAILGKDNVIEIVRHQKAPYWRIIETEQKRQAGNYVATADFDNADLGLESSLDTLRTTLNRLAPGRYIFTAFHRPDAKKSGVDSWIEVEGSNHVAAIGNTGPQAAYVEGIGMVTLDNIGESVKKMFAQEKAKEAEALRIRSLEEENRRLRQEVREMNSGINKGLISIGTVLWERMRGTAIGKEVIGMVNEFRKATADKAPPVNKQDAPNSAYTDAEVVGEAGEAPPEMVDALDELAKDNPDLIHQLQMLAKMKKESPELFKDAIEELKTVAG